MAEISMLEIGKRLKMARADAGLTQKQVADYLGVKEPQISYWEQGRREIDLSSLSKMADLYGHLLPWFLDTEQSREPGISISYRTEKLSESDLKLVAWAERFVKSLDLLDSLLEGKKNE